MALTSFRSFALVATLAASAATGAGFALADGHSGGGVAADRQALMKNVGAATKVAAGMAKGNIPFDANAASMAMTTLNNAALGFGHMFPEGSETGAKTEASPKIWSDRAGFDKMVAQFVTDTSAPVGDLGQLQQAFSAVGANCGTCHKAYRVKN